MVWVRRGWWPEWSTNNNGLAVINTRPGRAVTLLGDALGSIDCSWPPPSLHLSSLSPVVKPSPTHVTRQLLLQ